MFLILSVKDLLRVKPQGWSSGESMHKHMRAEALVPGSRQLDCRVSTAKTGYQTRNMYLSIPELRIVISHYPDPGSLAAHGTQQLDPSQQAGICLEGMELGQVMTQILLFIPPLYGSAS